MTMYTQYIYYLPIINTDTDRLLSELPTLSKNVNDNAAVNLLKGKQRELCQRQKFYEY